MKTLRLPLLVMISALLGAAIALAASGLLPGKTTHTTIIKQNPTTTSAALSSTTSSNNVNAVYKKDSPGVVDIVVTTAPTINALGQSAASSDEGAGVVYNTAGDILTDEHVVDGAKSVTVTFQDGKTASATVVGTDPSTDVAVIKVNVASSQLHPIAFANSSTAQVGDEAIAIGSPFSLPETTTLGIISQTGRTITAPNNYSIPNAIQTDAAINPGNSGGPLLTSSGTVLGLNDQIETENTASDGQGSSSGVGFAIPSNTVAKIANELIAGKQPQHSYLGVELLDNASGKAAIAKVMSNSPAATAGLKAGDVIDALNGSVVANREQLTDDISNLAPNTKITLLITRQGHQQTITATLGTRSNAAPSPDTAP